MAAVDYPACEERLKIHEGGDYTDGVHPYDPGGPTRWGITIEDARLYWKPNATADDVRNMPWSMAQGIYRSKYWARNDCDDLPAGVDDCVFDYGVNSGVARSGKVLRRVLGLTDDNWHTTPEVVDACKKRDANAIVDAICDERMRFLQGLAIWPTYRNGWTTRVREVRVFDHQLASHGVPPAVTKINAGKGQHPPPNTTGVGTGGGAATVAAGGFAHWLGSHPALTVLIVIAGIVLIGVVVNKMTAAHKAKQEGPTLGLVPVPELPSPPQTGGGTTT